MSAKVIQPLERFHFILIVHQEKTATAALFEKHDPLAQIGRILDDMGGRDLTLGVAGSDIFTFHNGLPKKTNTAQPQGCAVFLH